MSTPLVPNYVSETPLTLPRPPLPGRNWLREPLLHFMALGGLLFALDCVLSRRAEAPNTIHVGADVDRQAIETFRAARNRAPNPEELEALRRVWLDNEVLYREGLALQVDKGDPAIRERVIFKALSIVDSNIKLPRPSDDLLRAWFEKHRAKYDEPPRFDFEEAALSGQNTEAAVRSFVSALNAGAPGDTQAGLRVFKARPRSSLIDSYGPDFVRALESASPGNWLAIHTREGWRAVRLNASSPEKPAVFEAVRGVVLHDWTDATASEQRTAAVRAIAQKYQAKYATRP